MFEIYYNTKDEASGSWLERVCDALNKQEVHYRIHATDMKNDPSYCISSFQPDIKLLSLEELYDIIN